MYIACTIIMLTSRLEKVLHKKVITIRCSQLLRWLLDLRGGRKVRLRTSFSSAPFIAYPILWPHNGRLIKISAIREYGSTVFAGI